MSNGPLNSPGVRIILIDETIGISSSGTPVQVEPFRTPIRGVPPIIPDMFAEWEVDPQLFAGWEVDPQLSAEWEVDPPDELEDEFDPLFIILPFDEGEEMG